MSKLRSFVLLAILVMATATLLRATETITNAVPQALYSWTEKDEKLGLSLIIQAPKTSYISEESVNITLLIRNDLGQTQQVYAPGLVARLQPNMSEFPPYVTYCAEQFGRGGNGDQSDFVTLCPGEILGHSASGFVPVGKFQVFGSYQADRRATNYLMRVKSPMLKVTAPARAQGHPHYSLVRVDFPGQGLQIDRSEPTVIQSIAKWLETITPRQPRENELGTVMPWCTVSFCETVNGRQEPVVETSIYRHKDSKSSTLLITEAEMTELQKLLGL